MGISVPVPQLGTDGMAHILDEAEVVGGPFLVGEQGGLLLLYGVFFIGAAFTMTRKKVE